MPSEVGYGLGMFHQPDQRPAHRIDLADTLENFHVTPTYLQSTTMTCSAPKSSDPSNAPAEREACAFVEARRVRASTCWKAALSSR